MLKAYFDGSGKNDPNTKILTLGGLIASDAVWPDFEKQWQIVLKSRCLRSFHMTDAMASQRAFQGWPREKVDALVEQLWDVLSKFYGRHVYAKSCTIDLDDYRRAKTEIPQIMKPEEICVNFCVGTGLPPDDAALPGAEFSDIILYFDMNETFLRTIDPIWRRLRKRQKEFGWHHQVKAIRPVPAGETPALQAADLIAWVVSAKHRGNERAGPLYPFPLLGMHRFYDYRRLKRDYPNGWGL